MSQIGQYLRLAQEDIDTFLGDPDEAFEAVDGLFESEDPRLIDIDQSWNALAVLLRESGVSDAAVYGDDVFPGADEWGYTVPRMLDPDRVREFAKSLSAVDPEGLVGRLDPMRFVEAKVYPVEIWPNLDRSWLIGHLRALVAFFQAAADEGMWVLTWRA